MDHFCLAKAVDCFDNDLAGRVYGMRMAGVVDGISLGVVQVGDKLQIKTDERQIEMEIGKANAMELSKHLRLSGRSEMWKPPLNYKDWNDVVRGMPLEALQLKTKFQRDENLSRIRQEMRERNEQKSAFHR